jgi:hypothetical protein
MPLQFFDDVANETHGRRLTSKPQTAKSIRRAQRMEIIFARMCAFFEPWLQILKTLWFPSALT